MASTENTWDSLLAHPTFEAFALPTVETDNCRKPTHDIYHPMRGQPQNTNSVYTTTHGRVQYTYREHLPLSCLLTVFGSCEVSKVKDKRQVNALSIKAIPTHSPIQAFCEWIHSAKLALNF